MSATLTLQPILVATDSPDEEGALVLSEGRLVAVLVQLSTDLHGLRFNQRWFLEAGFGRLADNNPPTFANLAEARTWIARRLGSEPELALR